MPRKYFRKYLPTHEAVLRNRWIAQFGDLLRHPNLWHLNRHSVAGGVAVGMFTGLIPGSNPVQFTAAALVAILFRVNLPIAVFVTLYTNVFTVVPLYYLAFKLGQFVLMDSHGAMPAFAFSMEDKSFSEWISELSHWLTSIGKPLLIGLPLLAVIFSVIGYWAVWWGWRCYSVTAWRSRQRRRAKGIPAP